MQEIVSLKNIPNELKMNGLWCGWKLTEKGKVPFNLSNNKHAKSNDPSTFVSYPTMLNSIHNYFKVDENGKQLGGVGLGIFRGYSAIDIDHCVDENGELSAMARDIVEYCNSYTEYSPSKTGIRIIFKTNVKIDKNNYYINNHNNGLEIYISDNTNKFVTITGNKLSGNEIKDIDITYILNKYMKKGVFDIDKILNKDSKLRELWNATAPGSHANESNIDESLICKLAYYLKNDTAEIIKYFEMSPYYNSKDAEHKAKWQRQDYQQRTIRNATTLVEPNIVSNFEKRNLNVFELNDTGNARRFIEQYGDILRYNVDNKNWMIWNGNYWETDIREYVKNYIEILAEKLTFDASHIADPKIQMEALSNIQRIYSSAGKESLLKEARHIEGIPVVNDDFDKSPYLLCANNGTIDLRSGDIMANNKDNMLSLNTGVDISFEKPTIFLKVLNDLFEGDNEMIEFFHRCIGYSASGRTREQVMFIFQSEGNSGKSLVMDIICKALGQYSISCDADLITDNKYANANKEQIARLKNKRLAVIEELNDGDYLNQRLTKNLTSGKGKQSARFLYANTFELTIICKLWLVTNFDAIITGTDRAIWRRIIKIKSNADFTGHEDKDLDEKLMKELPQILGWIIDGYRQYNEKGLDIPQRVINDTTDYRNTMDITQQWVDECCDTNENYYERANVLYDNFRAFCIRRDLKTNQTRFGRNLSKKFKKFNSGQGIVYMGLRIKQKQADLSKRVNYERTKVDDDI